MSGPVSLQIAHALVVDSLAAGLTGNEDTIEDTRTCANKFFAYAANHGLESLDEIDEQLVVSFIHRAAHQKDGTYKDVVRSTLHNRRWQIGRVFETLQRLGIWDGPVLFGDPVPTRTGDAHRPLTEVEIDRVRAQAYQPLDRTRLPLVVALSEAGGTAPELAAVELADINLDLAVVTFRGRNARTNPIPDEALAALRNSFAVRDWSDSRRLTTGDELNDNFAKRSVTQALSTVMRCAGLSRVPLVSGRSIRLHQALNHFNAEGLGAAMRFLGNHSADTTMRSLGLTRDDL